MGLVFIDLECHSSINYASGNENNAWHASVRRPTPPSDPHLKIRGLEIALCTHWLLNQIQSTGIGLAPETRGEQCRHFKHPYCHISTSASPSMDLNVF